MTILVAYVPRPEGQAALEKGIEIATQNKERLFVVNASPGGNSDEPWRANAPDIERVEKLLAKSGLDATFKQFVRGNTTVEEIEEMVGAYGQEEQSGRSGQLMLDSDGMINPCQTQSNQPQIFGQGLSLS